jgi:hypothetical protein
MSNQDGSSPPRTSLDQNATAVGEKCPALLRLCLDN